MKDAAKSGRLRPEADVSFHMAISYATKNPLQVYIMKNFYDILFVGIKDARSQLYEDLANIDKISKQHTEIFNAIRDHKPDKAYSAMERHINFVLNFIEG